VAYARREEIGNYLKGEIPGVDAAIPLGNTPIVPPDL